MNTTDPAEMMRRTMENLDFINKNATNDGPYEVTQLINSYLGALAHPWEQLKDNLYSKSLSDSENKDWLFIKKELKADRDPENVGELIGFFRHGIAHGNISYHSGNDHKISVVKIWNNKPRTTERVWGTKLHVQELRILLDLFVDLAQELHGNRGQNS